MTPAIAARLAECGISLAARLPSQYSMFTRGVCVALVQTAGEEFVAMGSSGIMTENGLSYLVWSEGKAWLSAHGSRVEAQPEQAQAIRKFSEDVEASLGLKKKTEP